jgi:peptide/nickel transport system permease protein
VRQVRAIVRQLPAEVAAATRKHGKALGRLVPTVELGLEIHAQGFDFICYSGDVWVLHNALSEAVDRLRAGAAKPAADIPELGPVLDPQVLLETIDEEHMPHGELKTVSVMAGQSGFADEAFMKSLRAEYGLDQPLPVQLWKYVSAVAQGDLGVSYVRRQPVLGVILERLPNTLLLNGFALVVAAAGGIWLGSMAARKPGSAGDSAVTVLSMLFYAVPQFWLGMMMVLVFAVWLHLLPPFGIETMGADYTGLARIGDIAQHIILPGVTLALYFLASYARLTRTAMIEVADQDFVKTARAKGISERQVARRHILRNALIPLVTYAGLQASILVGGSVLVENVFSWPGIGTLAYEAVTTRDNPLLLGIFIVTALLVSLFNLITDVAYSLVDPRVELG